MPIATWICSLLALLLTLATFLPRLRAEYWWVRVFDFPRLQFAVMGSALLVVELIWLDLRQPLSWLLAGITGTCVVLQARWILPYTPFHPKEVALTRNPKPGCNVRLLVANVLTPNRNAQPLLDMIRENQPDLVIAVETDAWWQEQLDLLGEDYPHRLGCPQDNLYGMNFYSRLPLRDSSIQFLVQDKVPSIHTCVLLPSDNWIELHCIHPAPPSPTENDESSERDAELVMVGRSVRKSTSPVIVTGDLNDVAWSSTTRLFRKVSQLLDPRIGRGMFNTFHARWPFIRWPLDHLFHSGHFSLVRFKRLDYYGSDHLPILVELALNMDSTQQESFVDRDRETRQRAEAKLRSEGVSARDVHSPDPD